MISRILNKLLFLVTLETFCFASNSIISYGLLVAIALKKDRSFFWEFGAILVTNLALNFLTMRVHDSFQEKILNENNKITKIDYSRFVIGKSNIIKDNLIFYVISAMSWFVGISAIKYFYSKTGNVLSGLNYYNKIFLATVINALSWYIISFLLNNLLL